MSDPGTFDARPKADRQYGELYYSAGAVSTLLRAVAFMVEGGERAAVFDLAHSLPTTMPWDAAGGDLSATDADPLYRVVQFGLRDDTVLRGGTLRLACLVRRGPSPVLPEDWEHAAGVADRA